MASEFVRQPEVDMKTVFLATAVATLVLPLCIPVMGQAPSTKVTAASAPMTGAQSLPLPRAKPEEVGMSSERLALLDKTINADIAQGQLPGAVLLIARRGKIVKFDAFGYRDKEAGVPMTTDTIFNIASMTKPMTAVAALQLYEQGKLLMNDPLAKYFPQFAKMQVAVMDTKKENIIDKVPATKQISIQDLFRHTSGIPYGGRGTTAVHKMLPQTYELPVNGSEFLDRISSVPLLYQPGTVWDYGFSLDILGLVVESISGQRLGRYLQDHVWQPLGMIDTGFSVSAEKKTRYAKALPNDPITGRPQPSAAFDWSVKFDCGGGCSSSTASDYLRFALMLMNKGEFGDRRILGRKTVEYMLSNQIGPDIKNLIADADPTRADYGFGLGLGVRTTAGVVPMMGSVGEFNWPGATGTNWWADPKEELIVVWMAYTPGQLRWKYREKVNALVYQAIVD
jgi:CubicO group peptidase (beta-lactamase class C family)